MCIETTSGEQRDFILFTTNIYYHVYVTNRMLIYLLIEARFSFVGSTCVCTQNVKQRIKMATVVVVQIGLFHAKRTGSKTLTPMLSSNVLT